VISTALLGACRSAPLSQVGVVGHGAGNGSGSANANANANGSGTISKVETIEPGSKATYLYTVQLDGGDLWTFTYASDQGLRAGQRVRVVDGALQRY
jgi:hypothetical protein